MALARQGRVAGSVDSGNASEGKSMTVAAIPVDQRVIGIDSRRFAAIEKALVELITNSDDSYARREKAGAPATGQISVLYERHQTGAVLMVTDQAEGMSFRQASRILTYGGAHSPLSRGEGDGRGYFGRGLKQAIFGLGHGWIETIREGRFSRVDLFRDEQAGYLYDDGGADRLAFPGDYRRLGVADHGTRVTIVIDNPHVTISQYATVLQSLSDNVYLRDVLNRRTVELTNGLPGSESYRSDRVRFEEPAAILLLGPEQPGNFTHEGQDYPFTLTLKRAKDVELTLKGDERTNGLVVLSGMAALDCQLFEYENQVGTEYLFGTVRCSSLTEMLGRGMAIISDEREGLNLREPFVDAFSQAVSRMISGHVLAEKEKLKHLERATTSGRTAEMIEGLLHRMSEAAVQDLGISPSPMREPGGEFPPAAEPPAALRFTHPSTTGSRITPSTCPCWSTPRSCPLTNCSPSTSRWPTPCASTPSPKPSPSPRWQKTESGSSTRSWARTRGTGARSPFGPGPTGPGVRSSSPSTRRTTAAEASTIIRHGGSRETTASTCSPATKSATSTTTRCEPCTAVRSGRSSSMPGRRRSSSTSTAGAISATPPGCCWPSSSWT
jgi:hypothetical protein